MTKSPVSKHTTSYTVGKTTGSDWRYGHPMSVSGCTIILCRRGHAVISVNSRRFMIKPGDMAFFTFDMVTVPADTSEDFDARFLDVDFNTTQDIFFLVTSKRFWEFIYTTPVFTPRGILHDIACRWFDMLEWVMHNNPDNTIERVLHNETENFLLIMAAQIESMSGIHDSDPTKNRAWALANDFIGLLNRYYTRHHDVAFYAGKLNITPNYLNIIIKRNIGTTAKEQINFQIGLVLKTLLDTTDLTVKEIAQRLHYDDPSYLCRIFRKHTGMSPLQYRNSITRTTRKG